MPQTPLFQTNGNTPKHVTTGTNVVKANAGYLDRIVFNSASTSATLTLYDNPTAGSGTILAIPSFTANLASPVSTVYQMNFATGLTVVITGTVDATLMFH